MKVFVSNDKDECNFTYPDSMEQIINYLESKGKINVGYMTLEKLWYAFSETYDAQFLTPDEQLLREFTGFIKALDVNDAIKMDYYGNIGDEPFVNRQGEYV